MCTVYQNVLWAGVKVPHSSCRFKQQWTPNRQTSQANDSSLQSRIETAICFNFFLGLVQLFLKVQLDTVIWKKLNHVYKLKDVNDVKDRSKYKTCTARMVKAMS